MNWPSENELQAFRSELGLFSLRPLSCLLFKKICLDIRVERDCSSRGSVLYDATLMGGLRLLAAAARSAGPICRIGSEIGGDKGHRERGPPECGCSSQQGSAAWSFIQELADFAWDALIAL